MGRAGGGGGTPMAGGGSKSMWSGANQVYKTLLINFIKRFAMFDCTVDLSKLQHIFVSPCEQLEILSINLWRGQIAT